MTRMKAWLDQINAPDNESHDFGRTQTDKLHLARIMALEALGKPRQAMWLLLHSLRLACSALLRLSNRIVSDATRRVVRRKI